MKVPEHLSAPHNPEVRETDVFNDNANSYLINRSKLEEEILNFDRVPMIYPQQHLPDDLKIYDLVVAVR